jgi:hypothetical protein
MILFFFRSKENNYQKREIINNYFFDGTPGGKEVIPAEKMTG